MLAKWGREGVSPGESRRVSLPLSAKLLETREPASCCRMGRPPAPPHSLPARPPAEALPPTALPGGAELDSSPHLPLRARARAGRAARQEGGAGQSPPSPRGQRGQGRAQAAFPPFTPLPNPKMCALLGSQSLEEGVARDSSLPTPPPTPLSLSFPPFPLGVSSSSASFSFHLYVPRASNATLPSQSDGHKTSASRFSAWKQ